MSLPKYTVEALLKSEAFSHIQKDFLKAILGERLYTIPEASKKVREYFKKEEK